MSDSDATISARYVGALGSFQLDVAFDVPMRGITALFGPSGCGKTTILRCVAGLSRLPGRLAVGGDALAGRRDRHISRTVRAADWLRFPGGQSVRAPVGAREPAVRAAARAEERRGGRSIRLDDVVELLGVGHLLDRATGALSGGERQRVALGRALLSQPRLLLMDEPLSALDRMTKEEIFPYFEALHSALSIPVLYVSHDISEVERLADHMVLLEAGRVVATGPLNDLLADSRLPIARSPQAATVLEACVGAFTAEDSLTALDIDGETLLSPGRIGKEGSTHRVRIAASDVSLSVERPSPTTILNIVPVRVKDIQPLEQAQINVVVTIGHREGGRKLLVRVTRRAQRVLGVRSRPGPVRADQGCIPGGVVRRASGISPACGAQRLALATDTAAFQGWTPAGARRRESGKVSLDDPAAVGLTARSIRSGTKHHGRHASFHPYRLGERRSYRPGQDCAAGGDPLDRIDLGGRALARDVVSPRMAAGRGDQPCAA